MPKFWRVNFGEPILDLVQISRDRWILFYTVLDECWYFLQIFHVKQFDKMQTSFVCFLKIRKTSTTYSTAMCLVIWLKKSSRSYANMRGQNQTILLRLIWLHKNTIVNTEVGLMIFIL